MDGRIQKSINIIMANIGEATDDLKQFQRRVLYIICEVVLAMGILCLRPSSSIPNSILIPSFVSTIVMIGVFVSLSIVSSKEVASYHAQKESFITKYHDKNGNPIHTMNIEEYLIDVEEFSNATERFIRIYKMVNTANIITVMISMVMLFFTLGSVIAL